MKKILIAVILLAVLGGLYWFWASGRIGSAELREENSTQADIKGPVGAKTGPSGAYLVDTKGRTLYVSVDDENPSGSITQSCDAVCEQTWLPYLFDEKVVVPENSTDSLLSRLNVFTRSDGRNQYALGTQPLYRSIADTKTGDINGEVNATWMVAKP